MIRKPVRWRRVGVAALAGISLTLTALAGQVSPPNVHMAAAQAAEKGGASAKKSAERVATKLPTTTLDHYVGSYKMNDQTFIDVKREGEKLQARVTGQQWFDIFPERENYFFWKVTDAQIEFANDGTGSATLHQYGKDFPLSNASAGESQQAQAVIDSRVATQTATPGTEAALKHYLDGAAKSKIDYDQMEPLLAEVSRKQESQMAALAEQMGAVQSIKFTGVGNMGWDIYEVKYANGTLQYRIYLAGNGKIAGLLAMGTP